ncbi:hypothetical protein B0H17DRAFT_1286570 [Mycena rosella]|uniref:Uncharacterized protein n=1 Tax=Mycena rosella TaxID=1033263 RepID=A0AAD7BNS3_MYCRO|nr:hypothetical protein B0H17DRAFT_1286570 [Mycena rosella]
MFLAHRAYELSNPVPEFLDKPHIDRPTDSLCEHELRAPQPRVAAPGRGRAAPRVVRYWDGRGRGRGRAGAEVRRAGGRPDYTGIATVRSGSVSSVDECDYEGPARRGGGGGGAYANTAANAAVYARAGYTATTTSEYDDEYDSELEEEEDDSELGDELMDMEDDAALAAALQANLREMALDDWARGRILDGATRKRRAPRPLGRLGPILTLRAHHPRASAPPPPPPPMYALAEAAHNAYLRQLRVVLLPVFRNVVRRLVGLPSASHRNGKTENTHHSDRLEAVRRQMRNRHRDVRNRAQKSRPVEHTLDRDPRLAHCRCTICEPAMAVAHAAQDGHPASHAPPPTTTPHAKAEGGHEASLVLHIPTEEAGRGADSVVLLVSADEGYYAHTDDDGKLLVERDGGGEDESLSRRSAYFRQMDVQDGPGAEEREMAMIAEMRARGALGEEYEPSEVYSEDHEEEGVDLGVGPEYALGPGVWVAGRQRSGDELDAETDAEGRGDAARGGTPPKRARTGQHDYTPTIRLIKRRSEELDAADVDSDAAAAKRIRHDAADSPPDTNTPGTVGSGEESFRITRSARFRCSGSTPAY